MSAAAPRASATRDGINLFRVEPADGSWTHLQLVDGLVNPSFLAFDRRRRCLYTVHGDGSEASAFAIDATTGRLTFVNRQDTGGRNPVHLTVDPSDRFLIVANHLSSSVAVLPLDAASGAIGAPAQMVELTGAIGPHRVEQPFAKPHQVEFDPSGRFVLVPDKGLDRIFSFRFDPARGRLEPGEPPSVAAREAAGPRHVACHPTGRFAYVLNELDSTVMACHFDTARGALAPFQIVPSLPDTFIGHSRAAEIAVSADGRFVYASNRGHDSLAVYAVDIASGRLTPIQWVPSGGRTPRFFALGPSGDMLYAANEEDDTITGFLVERATGRLLPMGAVASTGSPVCILFR